MAKPKLRVATPLYLSMAPDLPDIGWSGPMPTSLTEEAARAVHSCDDPSALGVMLGELRSYWAAAGGLVMASFGGLACAAAGWATASAVVFALGIPAGLVTVESRRRARQWQAVIESRLMTMAPLP